MRRFLYLFFSLLLLPCLAKAQTTTITLQVTDAGGQSWNNGTWSVTLVSVPGAFNFGPPFYNIGTTTPVPNQSQTGALSGTGSASITLTQTASISPANSRWSFQVCSQATATNNCFVQAVTITTVTTLTLTPPTLTVNSGPGALAYADSEIVAPGVGATYYNVTSNTLRVCNGPTPCTWGLGGGGSAFGTPPASPPNVAQSACVTPPSTTGTYCLPGIQLFNQTAAGYTQLPLDRGNCDEIGAFTYVIPDAGSTNFGNNYFSCLIFPSSGAGTATINRSSASTFDLEGSQILSAQTSFTMSPGQLAYFYTNSAGNGYRVNLVAQGAAISGTSTLANVALWCATSPPTLCDNFGSGRSISVGNGVSTITLFPSSDHTYLSTLTTTGVFGTTDLLNQVQPGGAVNYAIYEGGSRALATVVSSNAATPIEIAPNRVKEIIWPSYSKVDLTAQTAAKTSTLLFAVPATDGAGHYQVCFDAKVTTAATTSSTLGGAGNFQLIYTDTDDSVSVTTPSGVVFNATAASLALNTTQVQESGCLVVNAKLSTNINYQFGYTSSGATPMAYSLHVRIAAMMP